MAGTKFEFELPSTVEKRLKNKATPYVFSRNAKKSDVFNKPLLVIGLGGSGYDALSRAKEKMINCFKTNSKGELEGVEFLEIDTDDRDMKNCFSNPKVGNLNENEFKIFQNADIGAILRNRATNSDVLPEEIDEWLDPNIPVAQIVHGAAGIRQAGRLLLHLNAIEIIDVLKAKLDKIRQSVVLSKNPINVVIFTGIGGGTGSGIFVDIAYMVRECIKEFSGQAFITGIILMPDILSGDPNVDKITKENIKRNGFAALKELDHLMNLSETQDTYSQRFPGGFVIDSTNEAIFDRCVLVSSMAEGRLLLPNAKEHAYNIAAEMLIDMISNSSIVSNGSNDVSRRDSALTNMKDRKPVNYVYTAVGGQAVYLDYDMIFNLFVKNVLEYDINMGFTSEQIEKKIEETWLKEKMEEAINGLVITRDNITTDSRKLFKLVYEKTDSTGKRVECAVDKKYIQKNYEKKYEPTEDVSAKDAFEKELNILNHKAEKFLEKMQDLYAGIDIRYDIYIDALKNRIQKALNGTRENPVSDSDTSKLQSYKEELEKYRDYFKKKNTKKSRFNKNIKFIFGEDKKILSMEEPVVALEEINKEEAENIKINTYNDMIARLVKDIGQLFVIKHKEDRKSISPELLSFYSMARSKWVDILKSKYDIDYSDSGLEAGSIFVQESIENVWEKNDSLLGESSIVPGKTSIEPDINFRNITVAAYIKTIDKLIKEAYRNLIDEAAREYKNKMTDNAMTEFYQGETGISPDITTGLIFQQMFEKAEISLDDIIINLFEIKKPELEGIWKKVVKAILDHSGVLYSKKAMKDGEVFERPSYNEFMIPRGNRVLASVCKELTGQEAEESDISHRISCMKYTQCQKIDDYIYIDELEKVYNQSNSKCGLHLYENKDLHWAKLPSPVYRTRYADFHKMNAYEDAKAAMRYRYVFYKGCQAKIIAYDSNAKKLFIDAEKLMENIGGVIMLNDKKIYLCTVEYNEAKNINSYYEYCSDWFVKMFKYRELVAHAVLGKKSDQIVDDEIIEFFTSDNMISDIIEGMIENG